MSDGTGVTSVWVADNKPEAAMPETNLSDVLEELRAIRALLERLEASHTAVVAGGGVMCVAEFSQ